MGKLLIVGSMAFDAIETPFGKTGRILGGAGTFIGLAASQFKVDAAIVSVVGDDFPQSYMDILKNKNIDLTGVEVVKGGKTFFWEGKYHNDLNSRDTLVTELNVLEHFDPIVPDSYQGCEYLMLGNLSPQVQRTVIERLNTKPKLIAMDTMNFWMDIALDELKKTIALVDVLIINDEEARQLSGVYSLVKAAKKIRKMGPKYLIIKKGEHGVLAIHPDGLIALPAYPTETVVDPTGCGDTFAGTLASRLALGSGEVSVNELKFALIHATVTASFTLQSFGVNALHQLEEEDYTGRIESYMKMTGTGK